MRYASIFDPAANFLWSLRAESGADWVVKVAAAYSVVCALTAYWLLAQQPIFGHDEVHYYVDFRFKLVEDGRWLNFLLHDFLRSIPIRVWCALYVAFAWLLFFRLARACALDLALATIVASTVLVATPFSEMSLWSASVTPSLLVLLLATGLQQHGMKYPFIYLGSGVLLFGAMQSLYFVLPLLFLPQFLDVAAPARERWLLLFKHMLWWVGGAVAGVLVMMLMLWALAGLLFPQPAAWRDTHPAVDLAGLVRNIEYVGTSFGALSRELLRLGGATWFFLLVCIAAAVLRARTLRLQAPALLLILAVLLSFFAFSIPLAPVIHLRSLMAMALALILALALLPGSSATGRVVAALLLVRLAGHYAEADLERLKLRRDENRVYVEALRDLFPGYSWTYSALALDGTMDPAQPEASRFNDGSRMHPLMVSLGVNTFYDCRIPQRCDGVDLAGELVSELPFAGGRLELSVNAQNVGIVRYRGPNSD